MGFDVNKDVSVDVLSASASGVEGEAVGSVEAIVLIMTVRDCLSQALKSQAGRRRK